MMFQLSRAWAMPNGAQRGQKMPQTVVIGAALLIVCMIVGLILGIALHRRMYAAHVADIDGDISALRLRLRELRAEAPAK
jgi:hypothetical protein